MFNLLQPRGWRLKTQKCMMYNVSKAQAYMNAQAVMALAIFYGHGDVVTMSVNDSAIALTLSFDMDWYVGERETNWLSDRILCGANLSVVEDEEMKAVDVKVIWEFNPWLK